MNNQQEYAGMNGAYYDNKNGLSFSPILASMGVDNNPEHHIEIKTPDGQLFSLRIQKNILNEYELFLYHGQHIGKEHPAAEAWERLHSLKSYSLNELVSGEKKYENINRDMKNSFLLEMNNVYLITPLHDGALAIVEMTPQEICKHSQQKFIAESVLGKFMDKFSSEHYPTNILKDSSILYTPTIDEEKAITKDIISRLNNNECVVISCDKLPSEVIKALGNESVSLSKDEAGFTWLLRDNVPSCFLSAESDNPRVQVCYQLPHGILACLIQSSKENFGNVVISSLKSPDENFLSSTPSTFPQKENPVKNQILSRRHNDPR